MDNFFNGYSGGDGYKKAAGLTAASFTSSVGLRGRRRLDRILGDDVEAELDGDFGMQADLNLVLAEGLDRLAEVDAALLEGDTGRGELLVDVVRGDRAEELAALARLHGDGDARLLDLLGERLGAVELLGFAEAAGLLEGLHALAVGAGERHGHALGQEEIAGVAGADLDLVAFGAETVDGFEEEDFVISHVLSWLKLSVIRGTGRRFRTERLRRGFPAARGPRVWERRRHCCGARTSGGLPHPRHHPERRLHRDRRRGTGSSRGRLSCGCAFPWWSC